MNYWISFCIVFLFCLSANKKVSAQTSEYLTFDESHIELGEVRFGDQREGVFTFTNEMTEAIKIDIIDACECTSLDWTRKEILPGEQGEISFVFDSSKKEESETISIDITLMNEDPKTGGPVMHSVSYSYKLVK